MWVVPVVAVGLSVAERVVTVGVKEAAEEKVEAAPVDSEVAAAAAVETVGVELEVAAREVALVGAVAAAARQQG